MNHETIISAALNALPSDNLRKEEMFAIECALRMAVDLVAGDVPTRPNGDAEGTIRELTVECIARARRIDQLTTERNDFKKAWEDLHPLGEQLRYARGTVIELSRERATLNRDCFNLSIELDAERKRVAELDAALVTERDLVSRLMAENARIKRGDMFKRGEMASEPAREFVIYAPKTDKPSGWGDIPHEVAS